MPAITALFVVAAVAQSFSDVMPYKGQVAVQKGVHMLKFVLDDSDQILVFL